MSNLQQLLKREDLAKLYKNLNGTVSRPTIKKWYEEDSCREEKRRIIETEAETILDENLAALKARENRLKKYSKLAS